LAQRHIQISGVVSRKSMGPPKRKKVADIFCQRRRIHGDRETLEQGEAIISTLGIPFPVSTRIHLYEEYLATLQGKKEKSLRQGLGSRF
jgi:hypothetical protein